MTLQLHQKPIYLEHRHRVQAYPALAAMRWLARCCTGPHQVSPEPATGSIVTCGQQCSSRA
jgi:hypothetical protein